MALFTLAQALTVLARSRRGKVWSVPGWEVGVFSTSFAVLMRAFIHHTEKPILRSNYVALLAFLLVPNQNKIAPNT